MYPRSDLTDPATDVCEMCLAIARGLNRDIVTADALKIILQCENVPYSRFLEVLARISDRFALLESCIKEVLPHDSDLLRNNLAIVAQMQRFTQLPNFAQRWESTKTECFATGNIQSIRNLGVALQTRFPLKRISDSERTTLIQKLKVEIEAIKTNSPIGTPERAVIASLDTLLFMLERYPFFGALAVRRQAEEVFLQAAHFERAPGKKWKKAKYAAVVSFAAMVVWNLTVEAPTKINDALIAYEELPGRLVPILDKLSKVRRIIELPSPPPVPALPPPAGLKRDEETQ